MTPRQPPPPPSPDTVLQLLRITLGVLKQLPKELPLPDNAKRALSAAYQLADYHGIAPADAPHIPDDGQI